MSVSLAGHGYSAGGGHQEPDQYESGESGQSWAPLQHLCSSYSRYTYWGTDSWYATARYSSTTARDHQGLCIIVGAYNHTPLRSIVRLGSTDNARAPRDRQGHTSVLACDAAIAPCDEAGQTVEKQH